MCEPLTAFLIGSLVTGAVAGGATAISKSAGGSRPSLPEVPELPALPACQDGS